MKQISKLHFITTNAAAAEQACRGGVDWIQLRLKNVTYDNYKHEALRVQEVCRRYGATLIINDNAKLALEIKADGVHVGKEDVVSPEDEAALVAGGYVIGCTTNTIEDVLHLSGKPISYLGLGPFRFTTTKQHLSPVLGLEGYHEILDKLKKDKVQFPPIVGIGGVTLVDVSELLATGLHGIAISGAIGNAENISIAASSFLQTIQ